MIEPVNQTDITNLKSKIEDSNIERMLKDSYENIVLKHENTKLNIDFFIRHYYPVFRFFLHKGIDKVQEHHKDTCLSAEWITFSGGPYKEVDLIKRENGEEKVEFTLPGFFATPVIEGGSINGLSEELENFKNKLERLPQEGDKYFQHRIAPMREKIRNLSKDQRQRWFDVLDKIKFKYKLPDIEEAEGKTVVTTQKVETDSLEDLGFE